MTTCGSVGVLLALSCLGPTACNQAARDPPPATVLSPPDSLVEAGFEAYWAGELDSAEHRFSAALGLARASVDPAVEAKALHGLGRVAWKRPDLGLARKLGDQALALQLDHSLQDQLFDSYNVLGLIAYDDGRYFDAAERFQVAIQLADAAHDTVSLAKSLQNHALPLIELGSYAEARRLLLQALPMARAIANPSYEGRILSNLGMLAVRTGNPQSGLEYLTQARLRLHEAEDEPGELNALGQLGTAYIGLGEPGKALSTLDSALTESRRQEDRTQEALNLEQLASVFADAAEYPRALRMLDSAQKIHQELELSDEAATDLRDMAEIYRSLGNSGLGTRAAERAVEAHLKLGARLAAMQDMILLARLAQDTGDRNGAATHLREAGRLATSLGARSSYLSVAIGTAQVGDAAGDAAAVLRVLRGASADAAAFGLDRQWEVEGLLARAWARAGELDSAVSAGRLAVAAVERVRGGYGSGILRTSYLADRAAVYHDLVAALLRLGRKDEAFITADAARGGGLLEYLATLRADGAPTVRELAEEERQLLRRIDQVVTRIDQVNAGRGGRDEASRQAELERLETALDRIRSEYTTALVRADEQRGERSALAGGVRPQAALVQAVLRPHEAVLEYLIGADGLVVFVVTSDSLAVVEQAVKRSDLSNRLRLARELTGRPGESGGEGGASAALEALHEILIGPARRSGSLAGRTTLLIVPHAELTYLPFAALRNPATGRYLVDDFVVLDLPSAGVLPVLRQRSEGRSAGSAAGVVALAPFPRELPASSQEMEAIRSAMKGTRTVEGGGATERRLRAALAEADIVHVATHGVLNVHSPLFSRLELGAGRGGSDDDGRLEVHEVNRLTIAASLVFLSGCETGVGAAWLTGFGRGEDFATLTRAFLSAGAKNVLATLWRIEDRGAAVFAGHFYRELAEVRNVNVGEGGEAEALARAQRAMRRTVEYRSPYYWAGYRWTGSGDLAGPGPTRSASRER